VTDVLLSRGDEEVVFKLATNPGARFSQTGYGILVKDAEGDDRAGGNRGAAIRHAAAPLQSCCNGRPRRCARGSCRSPRRRRARKFNA